jgi:hypothetical protein
MTRSMTGDSTAKDYPATIHLWVEAVRVLSCLSLSILPAPRYGAIQHKRVTRTGSQWMGTSTCHSDGVKYARDWDCTPLAL